MSAGTEPYTSPGEIRREGKGIVVTTLEGIMVTTPSASALFQFDATLNLLSAGVSDNYTSTWEFLRKDGKLDRAIREDEFDVLKEIRVLVPDEAESRLARTTPPQLP